MNDLVVADATAREPVVAQAAARWSNRRLAWVAGTGSMLSVAAVVRGLSGSTLDPMWLVLGVVSALLIAVSLATYVPQPGQGLRLDLGCGPCAIVGLVLMSVAGWILVAGSVDGGNAAMSVVLAGFAMAQRLSQPATCKA